jgi:hypothetical protein
MYIEAQTLHTPFLAPVSKLGGETPIWIRAWSLIRNEKPIVLFENTAMLL